MGFWGGLGKVLSIAGPIVAAPFTGGASMLGLGAGAGAAVGGATSTLGNVLSRIGKVASVAGPTLSGLAGGAQKGREAENNAAAQAALFKQRGVESNEAALENRAGLDLRQRQFGQDSQSDAYRKALLGALGMNAKDVTATRPEGVPNVSFSGGLRPSALGPEGLMAAKELNRQAQLKLMNGEKFDALPAIERVSAPTYQKPGLFENLAGGFGTAFNAINGANAQNEQDSFQQKILDAIAGLSGNGKKPVAPPPAPQPGNDVTE